MLIEDGRIAAAGQYAELLSAIPPHAVVIDAAGKCVTPGFVDAHTHLVFAGNRAAEFEQRIAGATYQQIAAAGGGILRTVAATRAASVDELLASTRQHRDWMLRSGTTTIEAKSGYGLDRGPGPANYFQLVIRSARMEGFIVLNYIQQFPEAMKVMQGWIEEGELIWRVDAAGGLENAPNTLAGLFAGANFGKQLLKIADPSPV